MTARRRALPVAGKAGTVSLTHFDIGHAAGVNTVNQQRHMIKFIYTRGSEPRHRRGIAATPSGRNRTTSRVLTT